jgi:hypothetical protein
MTGWTVCVKETVLKVTFMQYVHQKRRPLEPKCHAAHGSEEGKEAKETEAGPSQNHLQMQVPGCG